METAADVMAMALWVGLVTAYVRRLLGPLVGRAELPGLYGPLLAVVVGELVAVGGWWLGLRGGDWRAAVVVGLQAALTAMGGYSGIKALLDGAGDGAGGRTGTGKG